MSRCKRSILLLLAPLLAVGCVDQTQRLNDLEDISPQSVTDRVYRNLIVTSVDTIRYEFGRVGEVRSDEEGNLYILDRFIPAVLKFDTSNQFIGQIGRRGSGPGEFERISTFDVRGNGAVAVGDEGRITFFDQTGTFVVSRYVGLSGSMLGVNDHSIVSGNVFDSLAFRALSDSLKMLFQYGRFDTDPETTSAQLLGVLDGFSGGTVLVATYTGLIIGYDRNGERTFATRTIDAPDMEEIRWVGDRLSSTGHASLLINVTEARIYVSSVERSEERLIDVYSVHNGKYMYSFTIPHKTCGPRYIIDNEMISACTDGEVLRTKVRFEERSN